MNRDRVESILIELGWISLTHRVLGGRPAESYALRHLMLCAGRTVTLDALASYYDAHERSGGCIRASKGPRTGTANAIRSRVQRVRRHLRDLGLGDVIVTDVGRGYRIERRDIPRIETALLFAAGIEIEEAA